MEASNWIASEVRALARRLGMVRLFAETIPMVLAAQPDADALRRADSLVEQGRRRLQRQLDAFQAELPRLPGSTAHRRFVLLRLRFDALLATYDIFADAFTQRAEHGTGALLRGLDRLARDGLHTPDCLFEPPALVCYLDRGLGGAVRRVLTPLPDGGRNAVALVRIPRERLLGAGLASLLHEVGHQGSALLELVPAYGKALRVAAAGGGMDPVAARYWIQRLPELLCDFWACAKLGVTATIGISSVMGLTPSFVFHEDPEGPHPMPWLRVLLSARFGNAIMPDPLWRGIDRLWRGLYPLESASAEVRARVSRLLPSAPAFLGLMATHRAGPLRGRTFAEALGAENVHPRRLREELPARLTQLKKAHRAPVRPCRDLALVGLARHLGLIEPEEEHDMVFRVLHGTEGEKR